MIRYLTSVDDTTVLGRVDDESDPPFEGLALMYLEARIEAFFGGDAKAAARAVVKDGWSNGSVYFRPVGWAPGDPADDPSEFE